MHQAEFVSAVGIKYDWANIENCCLFHLFYLAFIAFSRQLSNFSLIYYYFRCLSTSQNAHRRTTIQINLCTYWNTAFQSHKNVQKQIWPSFFWFLSSHQYELNHIPIQVSLGKEIFDFNDESKPFMNFCRADIISLTAQMFVPIQKVRFYFVLLSHQNATYMFYLCIKGISAWAGSASEVLHYLFAGFSLPRTTFSTARWQARKRGGNHYFWIWYVIYSLC